MTWSSRDANAPERWAEFQALLDELGRQLPLYHTPLRIQVPVDLTRFPSCRFGYGVAMSHDVPTVIDDGFPRVSLDLRGSRRLALVLLGDWINQPVDSLWDCPARLLPA